MTLGVGGGGVLLWSKIGHFQEPKKYIVVVCCRAKKIIEFFPYSPA